jgi:hypothetical protein
LHPTFKATFKATLTAPSPSTTLLRLSVSLNFPASMMQDLVDEAKVMRKQIDFLRTAKAVVTDIHFVIPLGVLLIGIAVLVELH